LKQFQVVIDTIAKIVKNISRHRLDPIKEGLSGDALYPINIPVRPEESTEDNSSGAIIDALAKTNKMAKKRLLPCDPGS
jgi:hypothetical protein